MNGDWVQKGNVTTARGNGDTTYWIYSNHELVIVSEGRCTRIPCTSRLRALGTAENHYHVARESVGEVNVDE